MPIPHDDGAKEGFRLPLNEYYTMKPLYTDQEFNSAKSRDKLPCSCINCGKTFLKPKNEILDFLSGSGRRTIEFCSFVCAKNNRDTRRSVACTQCHLPTIKSAKDIRDSKSGNTFCSLSCAAKWNNTHFPKQHKQPRHCKICGKSTVSNTDSCQTCFRNSCIAKYGEMTIQDFKSTYARHKYQGIRHHAHRVARMGGMIPKCAVCEYNTHVQLCHRVSIGSFSKNTLVKEVNAVSNLVFLCPTHHWEMDHGYRDSASLQLTCKLSKNNQTGADSQA